MHDLGVEPSKDTYDGFTKALLHGKGAAYGMSVVISLIKLIHNSQRKNVGSGTVQFLIKSSNNA